MDANSEFTLACRKLLEMVLNGKIRDPDQLVQAKKLVSKHHKLPSLPTNADIMISGSEEEQLLVRDFLRKKPVRTISGVAVIAAMTSPAPAPMAHVFPAQEAQLLLLTRRKAIWGRNPLQCARSNMSMIHTE